MTWKGAKLRTITDFFTKHMELKITSLKIVHTCRLWKTNQKVNTDALNHPRFSNTDNPVESCLHQTIKCFYAILDGIHNKTTELEKLN